MPKLPRITRSLRMFTSLERREETLDFKPNNLLKKRQERAKKSKSNLNWHDICKSASKELLSHLLTLRNKVQQALANDSLDVINEFTVYALRLLIEDTILSRKKYDMLGQKSGHLTYQCAEAMMVIITKIRKECYDEAVELLSESKENANVPNSQIFGANIHYNSARTVWPDTVKLHDMSTEKINSNADKFTTMVYETKPLTQKSAVSIC